MAHRATMILMAMAILVASQSIPIIAQTGCTTAIISLAPCLSYVSNNSATPSSSCCSQLSSIVKSQPQCLCMVVNGGGSSFGVSINKTRALALPGACNVQTPPVSQCDGGSTSSPAKSPVATPSFPASNPLLSTSPSFSHSTETGPSAKGYKLKNSDSSNGSTNKSVVYIIVFVGISASCCF